MKRIVASLALSAVLLSGCAALPFMHRTVEVQLLAINDLHGRIEPPPGPEGRIAGVTAGGAEYLATHLKAAARDNPNTIIVGAGDLIGATPLFSAMFQDRPTLEAVDAMGLGVTALGNHELDGGAADFLVKAGQTKAQYLAANVVRTDAGGAPLLPSTKVVEIGGVKIGFIGEILRGAPSVLAPKSARGLAFSDEADAANAAVTALKTQGVEAFVLLIHEGGGQTPAGGNSPPDSCQGFRGDILPILARLDPAIKVVVSGHTHEAYNCDIGGRRVTSAGSYGRVFTSVTLSIDTATDQVTAVRAVNHINTRDVAKDPAQTAILEKYRPQAAVLVERVAGAVTAPIERTPNAAGESALGDLIADAGLASAKDWAPTAQVAFVNTGGLRGGIGGADAPGQAARPVKYGELYGAQPFGNRLTSVVLTGEAFIRLLEGQFGADGGRDMLPSSKGLTYRYRLSAPAGQHIEPGSVRIDGRPVAPGDSIRIVAPDFLITGGDGHTTFAQGTDPIVGIPDLEALVQYFAANSPIAPPPLDRITRTDAP